MSEEEAGDGKNGSAQVRLQLQDFHVDAAAIALRELKEHGAPMNGYFSAACIMLYLEHVLKMSPEQGFENVMSCYRTIRGNPELATTVLRMMHEEIRATRIVVPGSGRLN